MSGLDPCILSPNKVDKDGYASKWDNDQKRRVPAHRWAYANHHGVTVRSLKGVTIRHRCDVRNCINPLHLLPGTTQDNVNDRQERGRQAKGQMTGAAKLTDQQAEAIRAEYVYRSRDHNVTTLAAKYGVSGAAIHLVLQGKTYKEAP